MKPDDRKITYLAMLLACILFGASGGNAADLNPSNQRTAEDMLTLVLATPAGDQEITSEGACTSWGAARTVREDVFQALAALSEGGSINAECRKVGQNLACQLHIGQKLPKKELVWSRTYEIFVSPEARRSVAPIRCYTVP